MCLRTVSCDWLSPVSLFLSHPDTQSRFFPSFQYLSLRVLSHEATWTRTAWTHGPPTPTASDRSASLRTRPGYGSPLLGCLPPSARAPVTVTPRTTCQKGVPPRRPPPRNSRPLLRAPARRCVSRVERGRGRCDVRHGRLFLRNGWAWTGLG